MAKKCVCLALDVPHLRDGFGWTVSVKQYLLRQGTIISILIHAGKNSKQL